MLARSQRYDAFISYSHRQDQRLAEALQQELQSFAESMLGTVHVYDRKHQTQLGATLRSYMANRCNVSVTAKVLHVHPNTLDYRLKRIVELTGLDPATSAGLQLLGAAAAARRLDPRA